MNKFGERIRAIGLSLSASLCLASATASQASADDKVFNWKIQTTDQSTQLGASVVMPKWAEMIKTMSNGRLNISIFYADQLIPTGEILPALENNLVEMAFTCACYYTGAVPEGNLNSASLPPMIIGSIADAKRLWWEEGGLDEIIREAYLEHGIYYVGTIFTGEQVHHWSRKPISNLAEMAGYKPRSYGYLAKTFQELGADPAFIPLADVYTSLASGLIDGAMTAANTYTLSRHDEVAPYFYSDPLVNGSSMSIMVSKKAWDELPADIQEIVKVANQWYSNRNEMLNPVAYQKMIESFPERGVTAISWPPEDIEKFREVAKTFLPEIAGLGPRLERGIGIINAYLGE